LRIKQGFVRAVSNSVIMQTRRMRGARVIVWRGEELLTQTDLRLPEEERFFRLPGGRMEPDESPARCAAREFAEEMGIEVKVGPLCYVGENRYRRKNRLVDEIIFYFRGELMRQLPPEGAAREPHLRFAWLPRSELRCRRCLPPNLFARMLADGPDGPPELLYILDESV
jgi:8-oxo-dGTP pyrophosphatase MutT (NUDIX family)